MKHFQILYVGHERAARSLLLEKQIKTAEELAMMTSYDVEKAINEAYACVQDGEDWLLAPKDKFDYINSLISWIKR